MDSKEKIILLSKTTYFRECPLSTLFQKKCFWSTRSKINLLMTNTKHMENKETKINWLDSL